MHETQRPWDLSLRHWGELFARNEADRRADYELSERLGAQLALELGLDLADLAEAA